MDPITLVPISALFAGGMLAGRNERVHRQVECPRRRCGAEVDVLQRYDHADRPVRVLRCDLLPDPRHVDCGQPCLKRRR